ncbi:MAG: sulfotransferase [Cellvibrio sp.]|uniref:tetratricopeptide repeat-containing sulfotransferase family protein n=1 Tax=Cellvibrio sp. TaxID=1965322 RepID=UPI0031A652F2
MTAIASQHEQELIQDSARVALIRGNYQEAYGILTKAVNQYPECAGFYFLLSRIAYDFKSYIKEVEMLTKANQLEPDNPVFTVYLARAHILAGNSVESVNLLSHAELMSNHTAESFDVMGGTYNRLCMYQQAADAFEKSIALDQRNHGVFFNLASSLKFCGDFTGARAAYERAIALKPDYFKAHAALTSLGGITQESNHVDRLRELLDVASSSDDLLAVAHALSKELEALKQYDDSIAVLAKAKRQKSSQLGYQFERDAKIFSQLQQYYADESVSDRTGFDNERAIFVVGMPRTGTTLVERILTNHHQVASGGELHNFSIALKRQIKSTSREFIDSAFVDIFPAIDLSKLGEDYINTTDYLTGDKKFLVDKLPLNILYAGLIAQALTKAKIVCLDRNPLDTIASNYRQLFSFQDSTFGYSLDLENAARYYVEFRRLVNLLQEKYASNFHLVNYEVLATNPDVEIRKLLQFCELDWDEACLHVEKNDKPVATASAVQVRKPISTSSIGQWRHYSAYLEPVKTILAQAGIAISE